MKLANHKPWELWASGFQWGILLIVLSAMMPGHGWKFYLWMACLALSSAASVNWMIRSWKLQTKPEAA